MEYESQIKYRESSRLNQILSTAGILASLLVIVFGVESIFELWSHAIAMTVFTFFLLMVIHGMEFRKKNKIRMAFCFGVAIVVFLLWIDLLLIG